MKRKVRFSFSKGEFMESPESISSARRAIGFWSLGFMVVLLLVFLISAPFFALSGSYGVALFIAIP